MGDGLRCATCGEEHTDWEKVGEPYVPAPDAGSRLQRIKCGRCGDTDDVGVP